MKINRKTVPKNPGVYFFRDKHGQILYIGKAANLKSRLASYFKSQLGGWTAKLMEKTEKIDWQETDSEIEALILESQFIKKYRPQFNIMLRDDKQYFYVVITKERFPKILLTHQPKTYNQKPQATIVGSFTDGNALKTTLRLLRRIFPYCTCKQKHNNYCLNYHIGKCLGFCCLKDQNLEPKKLNLESYKKNIKTIKDILIGKRASLIKKLKKEMADLGKNHDFEKAIELRDKIEKLEKIFENAQILHNTNIQMYANDANETLGQLQKLLKLKYPPRCIEGYDISNIQGKFATGAMAVFTDVQPDKNKYRKFNIKLKNKPNDIAMLKEVLTRRFNHPEWPYPDLIIVDGGKAQLNITKYITQNITYKKISIIALTKDARHRGNHVHIYTSNKKITVPLKRLPPKVSNLILQVDAEAHRFAISYYRKLHRISI